MFDFPSSSPAPRTPTMTQTVPTQRGQPCYSARLLQPFLSVIGPLPGMSAPLVERLQNLDPEQRVYVAYVHSLLECVEQQVNTRALGLEASAAHTSGDSGMFHYLMSSADTPRMAVDAASKYIRLLSDSLDVSLQVHGERAIARLESRLAVPRAAEDFAIATMMRNQVFSWPEGMLDDIDVWFRHEEPRDLAPYREAFGVVRLHFASELSGWSFPARYLEVPLRKRDARLHSVLRKAAEDALATLPSNETLTQRVSQLVNEHLASGSVTLPNIARQLRMHPRKLSRSLIAEGTTFQDLVESLRRGAALHHITHSDLSITNVARLIGFTGKAPFHRAFRRWTGDTPTGYRRKHRGVAVAARDRPARAADGK